jgi:hypothetical protein
VALTAKAERAAQELPDRHGVIEPPTPVIELAAAEGILVIREPFRDDGVSGALLRVSDRTMIIVNATNYNERRIYRT